MMNVEATAQEIKRTLRGLGRGSRQDIVPVPRLTSASTHRTFAMSSRTAAGEERERLWNALAEIYPPYLDYQKATERTIPVVVLDPA